MPQETTLNYNRFFDVGVSPYKKSKDFLRAHLPSSYKKMSFYQRGYEPKCEGSKVGMYKGTSRYQPK